jgi:ABC-type Fe3+-siderophore transport system permease subunit
MVGRNAPWAGVLNPNETGPMKELRGWLQGKLAGTQRSDILLAVLSGLIAWMIVLFLRAAVGE